MPISIGSTRASVRRTAYASCESWFERALARGGVKSISRRANIECRPASHSYDLGADQQRGELSFGRYRVDLGNRSRMIAASHNRSSALTVPQTPWIRVCAKRVRRAATGVIDGED